MLDDKIADTLLNKQVIDIETHAITRSLIREEMHKYFTQLIGTQLLRETANERT